MKPIMRMELLYTHFLVSYIKSRKEKTQISVFFNEQNVLAATSKLRTYNDQ